MSDDLDSVGKVQYQEKLTYDQTLFLQIERINQIKAQTPLLFDDKHYRYFWSNVLQLYHLLHSLIKKHEDIEKKCQEIISKSKQRKSFEQSAYDLLDVCLEFMQDKKLLLSEMETAAF